jgi:hypothetical protein
MLRILDGRVGPSGEMLHVGLSRSPAVHPNQMRRWVYDVEEEDIERKVVAVVKEEKRASRMRKFGFGAGEEEQDDTQGVEH